MSPLTERDQNRQDDEQREGADTDQSELDEVEGVATINGQTVKEISIEIHVFDDRGPWRGTGLERPIDVQIGLQDQLAWGLIEADDARLRALKN